jgi:polyisoprenoid-binding protein YceI
MHAHVLAAVLALGACTSLAGADDTAPPFSPAAAAPMAAAADYPVAVELPSGAYRLDPRHASVLFRIRHMDLAWFTARFDTKTATLEFDASDPSRSRLMASIDADSVNTGLPDSNEAAAFNRQIGRALGAERGAEISFVSTAIERTGRNSARVTGDLTMNGQTHPLTLDATFDGAAVDPLRGVRQVLGFSAHGEIDRAQWGVNAWDSFTGDTVQVVIEAEFVKS